MAIDRRQFLRLSAASVFGTASLSAEAKKSSKLLLASAYQSDDKSGYGVAVCDAQGNVLQNADLPSRGHASLFHPNKPQLLTFARRPGTYLQVMDVAGDAPVLQINAVEGRHFFGHGCFDPAGRLLFCTENDFDQARGVVGVYDSSASYKRVAEFDSYGVGPHELVMHPDGVTLIVANGGIETHPDYGREKLNLAEMRSSIAFIDSRDGRLIARFETPEAYQKLSLRHLAVNPSGLCFFGAQHEGAAEQMPPLLGRVSLKAGIELTPTEGNVQASLKNYIGSICSIPGSDYFVASASRGGVALVVDAREQQVVQLLEACDGSGVAAHDEELFFSSGDGKIRAYHPAGKLLQQSVEASHPQLHWDNHLTLAKR